MVQYEPAAAPTPSFDPTKKFVRVNRIRYDGFIEFEFAIGDPGLSLELIMPLHAYRTFCQMNAVAHLPALDSDHQRPSSGTGGLHVLPHFDE